MLHKQIISPNAAWVLVFNDAAAVYLVSPLATEQSCHRPLEWMSRSCYLHPGNTGTGSFQRSKNKFSDFIQVKNNYIFKNSDNESVSECSFATTHSCLSDRARKNTSNQNVRSTTSPTSCKILYNIESLPANSSIGWNSMSGYSLVKSAFYQLIEQSLVQISTDNYWPIG